MNTLVMGAIAALVAGIVLFAVSKKDREANGEWSSGLQWGYLLMMVGVFGVLSSSMSFTAVLLIFVLFTGVVWVWHRYSRNYTPEVAEKFGDDNHFRDYMSGFFPIILVVFLLRTFLVEPFQIPSSSMRPGLIVGDFILVNKYAYGIRTPIINNVLVPVGQIERGDVVVFSYPEDTRINYIKRAVGLPGDTVEYKNKTLIVNGKTVEDHESGDQSYIEQTMQGPMEVTAQTYQESMGNTQFDVLKMVEKPAFYPPTVRDFPFMDKCQYARDGSWFKCIVPEGQYFMMGDNRDNSEDSRYWGFVDDKLIVGKAFFIWMNFGDMSRIGTAIR